MKGKILKIVSALVIVMAVSISLFSKSTALTVSTPLIIDFDNNSNYDRIADAIKNTEASSIIINITGFGGIVPLGVKFMDVIYETAKHKNVIANVQGAVMSMHALLICAADNVTFAFGSYAMFHAPFKQTNFGTKDYTKNEGEEYQEKEIYDLCVKKGVLTQPQVNAILIDHKAVFVYEKDGKRVSVIGEDL
jgi:ATP-dependent protease ClpP protease subunit